MPSLKHEKLCLAPVAGVDEAGRGPLAGPVVAAAVILPAKGVPRGIDDSKKLPAAERARLHDRLRGCAQIGIGIVEADEIDILNIYWATMKAMTLAVGALTEAPACIPFCAERPLVATLNSCSASGNGSGRLRLVF